MKSISILLLLIGLSFITEAQNRYFTRTGYIKFFSTSAVENIEAHNRQVTSFLDIKTGEMVFAVLMKSFEFEKALMQEHFNENYVESDKFPKSTFKGNITNLAEINFAKDGNYEAIVSGDLTIHGVTKPIKSKGTITVKAGNIIAKTVFPVTVADHDIKIPSLVRDNIAKVVEVSVDMTYEKFEK